MYSEWNVWDMTNGEECIVKAESLDDFLTPKGNLTWIILDSKYEELRDKNYYYFREIGTKRIFRVDKK